MIVSLPLNFAYFSFDRYSLALFQFLFHGLMIVFVTELS